MKDNLIKRKSRDFAIDIINTYKNMVENKKEFVLSKQLLRSGTSIGANIAEGIKGQSKPDFYSKLNIALKEASETIYWLDVLHATDYLPDDAFNYLNNNCEELVKILTAITKNQNINK
ncbi:MAG: four helix bundle protein [Bacteroidales bacterium]|nr:four helix bundle protein [Bacteroidales bacterium]